MNINNVRNWKQFLKRAREPLLIVILFIAVYFFNTQVARIAVVNGESMYPTFLSDDILLINQLNYEPACGDIVLIDVPENTLLGEYIVKRIIAVEGDTISLDYGSNSVFLNGSKVPEPYINFDPNDPMEPLESDSNVSYQVPPGTVFVMGDNRNVSLDSRSDLLGMVETENIIGKVCLHFSFLQYFS